MLALIAAIAAPLGAFGQDAQSKPPLAQGDAATTAAAEPMVYDGGAGALAVASPWVPAADIDIDGRLAEAAWDAAPVLTGFTQFDPVEGVPATQRTEARLLVTDDALYVGIKAFDDMPGGPRATLGDRDSFGRSDDYVRIVLDTFNDRRRAYVIMANPYGVQQDGLWVVGGGGGRRRGWGPPIDWDPDFVWDSDGQMFDWGYSVEIRLPFKSIRFPDQPMQDWGLQVERRIARSGYGESWAPVTANTSNQMEQFGSLTGLADLDPGLFLELNPVQTITRQGAYDDAEGALRRGAVTGDFGINATYGITSNLTLDGTFNPDFSQVEADAGQIAVNERFALFLREKRPFFLEGTEIFQLPRQLVYTRSIVNPVGGAKLTGKVGGYNVGYLGAVDEVADPDGGDEAARPLVNVLRLRRDIGDNSTAGAIYTDRTYGSDRYNRVAGLDGRLEFRQRYALTLLAAGSRTATGDPQAASGGLFSAGLDRSGRNFSFNAGFSDITDDFVAGSGFIRRTGTAQANSRFGYNFRGSPGDAVERWGPSLEFEGFWDHDDFWDGRRPEEARVQVGGSVSFRGNVTVWANYSRSFFHFAENAYDGLFVSDGGAPRPFLPDQDRFQGMQSATLFMFVNTFSRARGNVRVTRLETPLFEFATDTPADVADAWSMDASLDLFPATQVRAEVGVRHTVMRRQRDGSLYSRATIPRLNAQYQFTRALFVRAIAEYGSQERRPLLTPAGGLPILYCSDPEDCSALSGSASHDFSLEALVGYEPTPGTVFYLGYTRLMEDTQAFRFRDVRPQADGLFAKLSYRFRR